MTISGVYVIKNLSNGHFYVGSSKDTHHRWICHKSWLAHDVHDNSYLQNAWNKYGDGTFKFDVIVECDEGDLAWIEQVYLDRYWGEGVLYNLNPRANRLEFTDEIRAKIGAASAGRRHSEETKRKISAAKMGQRHTEATKRQMSMARQGENNHFWGKSHSKETRRKISAVRTGITAGTKHHNACLLNEDVWEIRRLAATGKIAPKILAKMWRTTPQNICLIVNRYNWSHI